MAASKINEWNNWMKSMEQVITWMLVFFYLIEVQSSLFRSRLLSVLQSPGETCQSKCSPSAEGTATTCCHPSLIKLINSWFFHIAAQNVVETFPVFIITTSFAMWPFAGMKFCRDQTPLPWWPDRFNPLTPLCVIELSALFNFLSVGLIAFNKNTNRNSLRCFFTIFSRNQVLQTSFRDTDRGRGKLLRDGPTHSVI